MRQILKYASHREGQDYIQIWDESEKMIALIDKNKKNVYCTNDKCKDEIGKNIKKALMEEYKNTGIMEENSRYYICTRKNSPCREPGNETLVEIPSKLLP